MSAYDSVFGKTKCVSTKKLLPGGGVSESVEIRAHTIDYDILFVIQWRLLLSKQIRFK